MKCPKCNKENPNGTNFCIHCGERLNKDYKSIEDLESENKKQKDIIKQGAIELQKEKGKTQNAEEEKKKALVERDTVRKILDDAQRQHAKEKADEQKKNKIILSVLLTLFLLLGGVYAYQYFNIDNNVETISAPNEVLSKLPGNYTLREYNSGNVVGNSKTAVLRKEDARYTFTIVTEYGPEQHSFINTSSNLLHSETLGEGEVTYKEVINKTTITFKKNNITWEFVK